MYVYGVNTGYEEYWHTYPLPTDPPAMVYELGVGWGGGTNSCKITLHSFLQATQHREALSTENK